MLCNKSKREKYNREKYNREQAKKSNKTVYSELTRVKYDGDNKPKTEETERCKYCVNGYTSN
jgi:hypothetical protein